MKRLSNFTSDKVDFDAIIIIDNFLHFSPEPFILQAKWLNY